MDIQKEHEAIIQKVLEGIDLKTLALSLIVGFRAIKDDNHPDDVAITIEHTNIFGGPYKIEYEKAANVLFDLAFKLIFAAHYDEEK